ncbi:MAG: fasciclin domain-containing protein [Acidimicrobiales bacterium]|nr:fasciclin domain-containing protein [Acidimicrobiales bacterium]
MDSNVDELHELVSLLEGGDLSGLRRRYRTGGLAFLLPTLGPVLYRELGASLDSGDRRGVWALLIDKGLVATPAWLAEEEGRRRKGGAAWVGLLPLVILLAAAALALGRCGDDDETVATGAGATATTEADAATATTTQADDGDGDGASTSTSTTAKATTTTAKATTTTAQATTTTAAAVDPALVKLATDPRFSTLAGLVTKAGLLTTLNTGGPLTVFAPTNDAFAALPPDALAALGDNAEQLKSLLTYHVVGEALPAGSLTSGVKTTLNGEAVTIAVSDAGVSVNSANVNGADLATGTIVVHSIDQVLLPAGLQFGTGQQQKFSVFFDVGVTTPNAASQATLDQAVAAAQAAKASTPVVVTGFADVSGDPASNLQLSGERAQNVLGSLRAANAGLAYLPPNAKGDTEPGADLDSSRRVDIVIG